MKSVTQEPAVAVAGKIRLAHLSDEQVIPLLLAMDPDTLLNFGKTSTRFFNLVCDQEVWRQLLKKTAEFTKEKVEHLKAFKGSKGSEEMMPEMVKEAARRIPFSLKPMPVLVVVYPRAGGATTPSRWTATVWRSSLLWLGRRVSSSFWLRQWKLQVQNMQGFQWPGVWWLPTWSSRCRCSSKSSSRRLMQGSNHKMSWDNSSYLFLGCPTGGRLRDSTWMRIWMTSFGPNWQKFPLQVDTLAVSFAILPR